MRTEELLRRHAEDRVLRENFDAGYSVLGVVTAPDRAQARLDPATDDQQHVGGAPPAEGRGQAPFTCASQSEAQGQACETPTVLRRRS
ncbi:MAG TPA: hypothetical protein VFI11_01210 [Anaerolineales bacterium]|nr:hypothetical protein [Anaerolineales bacterium]